MKEITYKGIAYQEAKADNNLTCSGCAFINKKCGSRELYRHTADCYERGVIFIKKRSKK